jgi:hypothetical protein
MQMLVFHKHRLVFLATPKTGSTAIETALADHADLTISRLPELKHTPLGRYNRFLAPYLKAALGAEFETCALIRQPQDWLGSWYRYRQRDGVMPGRSTKGISFDAFVQAYASQPRPGFAQVGSQAQMLQTKEGARITHLFRYEQMGDFVAFLQQRLDVSITLPRINVSPRGAVELTATGRDLLRSSLAADFVLYDSLI